jgi:uncharacterized protein YqgC (DUF456 family)
MMEGVVHQQECALSFDASWLAWAAVWLLIVVGVAGTVLPVLPGTVLVFAGIFWGAWLDNFAQVPVWVVVFCGVLGGLAIATDYVAAALGAKRVRASGWAIAGAAIGTVAGIFTGLIGLLFMPLVGAMAGEWFALRKQFAVNPVDGGQHHTRAVKVGVATWIGMLVGTAVKLALTFVMIGAFIAAYFF